MQANMLDVAAIGHRTRFAWLGLALGATLALMGTSAHLSTAPLRDAPGAREREHAENIERLHHEIAAQAELNMCLIQLHARCEIDCWREAQRANRPCPTYKAAPAALARKAQLDELRALLEAELARHAAEQPERHDRRDRD